MSQQTGKSANVSEQTAEPFSGRVIMSSVECQNRHVEPFSGRVIMSSKSESTGRKSESECNQSVQVSYSRRGQTMRKVSNLPQLLLKLLRHN